MSAPVHVAVGVILDAEGRVLLSKRADDAHQGGLWEFPGGKVEDGESVPAALERELREELSITPLRSSPLIEVSHDYGDKSVMLDVHMVWEFSGEPAGVEGQPLVWVAPIRLGDYDFPAANLPILRAVQRALADQSA